LEPSASGELNTKRIVREQEEKKLDPVLEKPEAIERRLNKLENW
jgi:hypothetical protein